MITRWSQQRGIHSECSDGMIHGCRLVGWKMTCTWSSLVLCVMYNFNIVISKSDVMFVMVCDSLMIDVRQTAS